nr:AAA domain protein [uncultured bacterium]
MSPIQGVRQSGKSFLVREILKSSKPQLSYVTFDQRIEKNRAAANPETFLLSYDEAFPLVIDEAQKVPDIFDALKYEADTRRRPGKFLILGSTEFSKETLIRESLTGRMARLCLFPFNIKEAQGSVLEPQIMTEKKKISLTRIELLKHLKKGGFPGIFAVRDNAEHQSLLQDWLQISLYRDLMLFPRRKPDPELAYDILKCCAINEDTSAPAIASYLKKDPRRVKSHIELLLILFILHPLPPFPGSSGQTHYFLCDSGLATYLGAEIERQLHTQLIIERMSQHMYQYGDLPRLYFYRGAKGKIIHLVEKQNTLVFAYQIFSEEKILDRDLIRLKSFKDKMVKYQPAQRTNVYGLAAFHTPTRMVDNIWMLPWESMA